VYIIRKLLENIDSVSIMHKTKILCIILLLILDNRPVDPAYAKKYKMYSLFPEI